MPWTTKSPPSVAKHWTAGEKAKCVKAANAVLREGGSEESAIFACIRAAGRTKHPGGKKSMLTAIKAMLGIGSKEMSHDEIQSAIYNVLPKPVYPGGERPLWVKAVYDGYAIIEGSGKLYKAEYKIDDSNVLTIGKLEEVEVDYVAIGGKAIWTTAYKNDLPDSAFLYIGAGGKKDSEGKTTPRSLRKFPYKDASGKVDLPHLRNAIARIPQAKGISAEEKKSLQARARRILAKAGGSKQKSLAIGMKSARSAFEIVTDNQGRDRWTSWTAPSFMDGETQIAASKALEAYAEAAMETGIHGELWFGHFPIRLGEPDIHLMISKHLFESGLFDESNPDAVAMKEYLKANGPWEVSYKFLCSKEDDRAGLFNWLWLLERSPLPVGTAAHPMVKRLNMISGVKSMSGVPREAYDTLVKVLGEEKVKQLEETGTSLVKLMADMGIEGKSVGDDVTGGPDDKGDEGSGTEGQGDPASSVEGQDAILKRLTEIDGRLTLLAEGVVELADIQKSLDRKFVDLETQVKSLGEEDDTKIGAFVAGLSARDKASLVAGGSYRPREAAGLVQKSGVGQSPDEAGKEYQTGLAEGADGWAMAHHAFRMVAGMKRGGDGNG